MTAPTDLAWDHSIGENLIDEADELLADDFNDVSFYNGALLNDSTMEHDNVKLSRRHLSFLLRSLEEATSLLRQQQTLQDAATQSRAHTRQSPDQSGNCGRRCSTLFNRITKFNLLITFVLQTAMLIAVTIIDSTNHWHNSTSHHNHLTVNDPPDDWSTYFVMLFITIINLGIVIYISVELTRTIIKSRATALMLAQAYLSTVIMFAGIYVITYRWNRKGWTLHGFNAAKDDEVIVVSYLYLKMLYHSISTSTLCGSSTIHPDIWYNFLLMSLQMLLSFLYFTSILRVVVSPASRPPHKPRSIVRTLVAARSSASIASATSAEQTPLIDRNGISDSTAYGGL